MLSTPMNMIWRCEPRFTTMLCMVGMRASQGQARQQGRQPEGAARAVQPEEHSRAGHAGCGAAGRGSGAVDLAARGCDFRHTASEGFFPVFSTHIDSATELRRSANFQILRSVPP